jgi:hypothetical protein
MRPTDFSALACLLDTIECDRVTGNGRMPISVTRKSYPTRLGTNQVSSLLFTPGLLLRELPQRQPVQQPQKLPGLLQPPPQQEPGLQPVQLPEPGLPQ